MSADETPGPRCVSGGAAWVYAGLIALQFSWRGEKGKPMSSCFLGTSPEFEIAAYTVCFLSGKHGRNMDVQLGEYEVEISCIPLGRDCIGTAYIAAARMN